MSPSNVNSYERVARAKTGATNFCSPDGGAFRQVQQRPAPAAAMLIIEMVVEVVGGGCSIMVAP